MIPTAALTIDRGIINDHPEFFNISIYPFADLMDLETYGRFTLANKNALKEYIQHPQFFGGVDHWL